MRSAYARAGGLKARVAILRGSTRNLLRRRSVGVSRPRVLLVAPLTLAVFILLVTSAGACLPIPDKSTWEGHWNDGFYSGTWRVDLKSVETSPGVWQSQGTGEVVVPFYGALPGQLEATTTCTGETTANVTGHWTDPSGDNTTEVGTLSIGTKSLESGTWSGATVNGPDAGEWYGEFRPTGESGGKVKGTVEVESSPGTLINSLQIGVATELPLLPGGDVAPIGSVSFAANVPPASTIKVKLILPTGTHPTALIKLINHEYVEVPATINGETVEFEITDGGPFDEDHVVNGEVIDPVIPVSGLHVETSAPPEATRGMAYSTQLVASGGIPPYKWKKVGKLPKGLKLNKEGVLSGTPKSNLVPGPYQVAVTVADSTKKLKRAGTATFTLNVN